MTERATIIAVVDKRIRISLSLRLEMDIKKHLREKQTRNTQKAPAKAKPICNSGMRQRHSNDLGFRPKVNSP
jgi:hypothetical protein